MMPGLLLNSLGISEPYAETISQDADHIFIACGATDFRKGAQGLSALISLKYQLDPYEESCVFIFCNRRKTAVKVLRYDRNGFILASKKLLDQMKFQWPKTPEEAKKSPSSRWNGCLPDWRWNR